MRLRHEMRRTGGAGAGAGERNEIDGICWLQHGAGMAVVVSSMELTMIPSARSNLASKSRHLKRGVKEVVKSIRKGEKG